MQPIAPVSLAEIEEARARDTSGALRSPLVRVPDAALPESLHDREIYLKLENLQPIGSFKLRGSGNAIAAAAEKHDLNQGVYTASVGNMAQGVAWNARRRGIPCRVVVPTNAPENKIQAFVGMGAEVIRVSFDDWWQVMIDHHYPGVEGVFIHPVSDPAVIAGNGVIGLEIAEDLPDVDTVIAPFGGGGLSSGIACALRELAPRAKIWACEVETAAPLSAALAAGEPQHIDYTATFIEGIGGSSVLTEMWPLARDLLAGSIVVSVENVADAVRRLVERCHVVAEGAAAASFAAALRGTVPGERIVCMISGGNIDTQRLRTILDGRIPPAAS